MPILAIEEDSLRQRCALCAVERLVTLGELPPHDDVPEGSLVLPPCACGAVEHLLHAPPGEPEHPAPGSFGHKHRLLVDALVEELRGGKRALARRSAPLRQRVEARLPHELLERCFSEGLRTQEKLDGGAVAEEIR
ncbi:MAG: hypothetical protein LC099_02430 [Anaerolineales bacterium]|nr:hypothetical protein [Anaerolineales bacterium]